MADKAAVPAPTATPEEVVAYAAAQEEEWGTYVAAYDYAHNGTPTYRQGDPIAVTNVKRYKYDESGLAVKIATKSGQDIARALHESANPDPVAVPTVSLNIPVK